MRYFTLLCVMVSGVAQAVQDFDPSQPPYPISVLVVATQCHSWINSPNITVAKRTDGAPFHESYQVSKAQCLAILGMLNLVTNGVHCAAVRLNATVERSTGHIAEVRSLESAALGRACL